MAKMGHGHQGHHGGHHQGHHGHQGHGHQGHVVVVAGKKARGGKVKRDESNEREEGRTMSPKPMEDERTRKMVEDEERGEKRGGKVMGHHTKARHDRRARGGRMTPKSPFSGADGPNLSYARSKPTTKFEGEGEHPRP